MNEEKKLSLDIAVQSIKLLIALATSVLAFTVTFPTGFNQHCLGWLIKIAWIFLAVSVISGVLVLHKIIGTLEKNKNFSLYESWIRGLSLIQIFSFLLGVSCIAFLMLIK